MKALHPLDGIRQKLKRAEQNILSLNGEINSFLDTGDYRAIPNDNENVFRKALQYHSTRNVPIKFSVLAGEIIYHLRSSLDHLVWQLVIANKGKPGPWNEFPIFKLMPSEKDIAEGFRGKIKGVSLKAAAIIESLQPYHAGTNAANDRLWILHDLCRIDKHRELVIVVGTVKLNLRSGGIFIQDGAAELLPKLFGFSTRTDMNYKLSPQVSFKEFGSRKLQSVCPGLAELLANISRIVDTLSAEID